MDENLEEFWNSRVNHYGHTGWSDYIIYAFDQPARLKTIYTLLEKYQLRGKSALDFGCGTGDFSALLSKFFDQVHSYDICKNAVGLAKKKNALNKNIQFFSGPQLEVLPPDADQFDLILCVTVLDHIKNDIRLNETLQFFHSRLSSEGTLLLLEYAPTTPFKEKNYYQRFDLFNTWSKRLSDYGFSIYRDYGFYQPEHDPSKSYTKYRSDIRIKFWQTWLRFNFAKKQISSIAKKLVADHDDYFYKSSSSDLLKIMMMSKK